MTLFNVHVRVVRAPRERVFAELEAMGTEADRVWPDPRMPFRRSPGALRVGETVERHGMIRAVLGSHRSGEALVWNAELPFLRGSHGFHLAVSPEGCRVEHVLEADLAWWFRPLWWGSIGRVHDRIIEALFDRLEVAVAA